MDILIIDDEEIVRRTLQRYIEHRGDTPYLAENGRTGLELLQEQPIDLIITDVRMPDIDGMEVLHQVRDHHAEIPVIIVTAKVLSPEEHSFLRQGATHILQKGQMDHSLLLEHARSAIQRPHAHQRASMR